MGRKESTDAYSQLQTDDVLGLYLYEIGKIPLLKDAEIRYLCDLRDIGREAQFLLESDSFSFLEEEDYLGCLVEEGLEAQSHLFQANLRLVVTIAKEHQGRGLDLPDLIQDGNFGLMTAVGRFDHHLGYKFSGLAFEWIK